MRLHLPRHARLAALCVTFLVAACALVVAPAGASAATQGCADDASGVSDYTASWEADLLRLTNEHRTGMGLVALQLDTTLTRAAVWKARDMARRDYFAHDDQATATAPARTPWERLSACGWTTGGSRAENIAAGYSSAQSVITGWLNSPGHRANIENADMRYVGFGVANGTSSTYGTYSVQMFASVAGPSSTTPISTTPTTTTGGGDTSGGGGDTSGTGGDGSSGGTDTGSGTDGGTRTPLEQGGGTASTAIADPRARVVRSRCRGRLAVRGWCYRIVVTGRVSSSEASGRMVVISRRSASRRLVRIARLRTGSTGRFYRSVAIKPPARNTGLWLRRNATTIRIAVAASTTASGTTRWTTSRVALRRR